MRTYMALTFSCPDIPPRAKWLKQKSGGWSLFPPKRRQLILEQHRGLFIWGASLAGCPPETDFPCPSLGLQRFRQGESGQKEVENSLFTFHWETWTRNQCFRPSLSRFPRQDSLTLQSALKGAVAETVQSCCKDFHVAFTARKTPSPLWMPSEHRFIEKSGFSSRQGMGTIFQGKAHA